MEEVVFSVAGIIRNGKVRGHEFLGAGKIRNPENSLIVTNQRILFVYAPLPGGDKLIAGADIGHLQWLTMRGKVEEKLHEMISSMSLDEILNSSQSNYFLSLRDLKKVKIRNFFGTIIFITKENKKYRYSIRKRDDLKALRKVFKNYM